MNDRGIKTIRLHNQHTRFTKSTCTHIANGKKKKIQNQPTNESFCCCCCCFRHDYCYYSWVIGHCSVTKHLRRLHVLFCCCYCCCMKMVKKMIEMVYVKAKVATTTTAATMVHDEEDDKQHFGEEVIKCQHYCLVWNCATFMLGIAIKSHKWIRYNEYNFAACKSNTKNETKWKWKWKRE